MVEVQRQNTQQRIRVSQLNSIGNVLLENGLNNGNIFDLGNLFIFRDGVKLVKNGQERTVSADFDVMALKSDLSDFLVPDDIECKADRATTLIGYGIIDGLTYEVLED